MERLHRAQRTRFVEQRPPIVISKTTCRTVASGRRRSLRGRDRLLWAESPNHPPERTRDRHLVARFQFDPRCSCGSSQQQAHRNPLAHNRPRARRPGRPHLCNGPAPWANLRQLRPGRTTRRHTHSPHPEPRPPRPEQRLGRAPPSARPCVCPLARAQLFDSGEQAVGLADLQSARRPVNDVHAVLWRHAEHSPNQLRQRGCRCRSPSLGVRRPTCAGTHRAVDKGRRNGERIRAHGLQERTLGQRDRGRITARQFALNEGKCGRCRSLPRSAGQDRACDPQPRRNDKRAQLIRERPGVSSGVARLPGCDLTRIEDQDSRPGSGANRRDLTPR
jgi:hypothetical protein